MNQSIANINEQLSEEAKRENDVFGEKIKEEVKKDRQEISLVKE